MKPINRTVWILSLVSLFADVASEMLYPVIPVYLREAGFSFLLIGLLEGFANFTSGISKGFFGKRSDETGKRLPFVRTGYFFSAVSKPLFAFSSFVPWIFFARLLDRLGKGVRTAARDALLSDNATPQTKGTVFGFHRAMDTAGAALGPLLALLLLRLWPGQYKTIFLLAFLPGIFSVALIFLLREVRKSGKIKTGGHFLSYLGYWKEAGPAYRKVAPGLLFLALFNSADVFLLLKAREVLGSDAGTIGAYLLYNTVFALASYPLGRLADRIGLGRVYIAGLLLFALVYGCFALSGNPGIILAAFVLYGIHAAATEGIAKAWISNLAQEGQTATAIGWYTSVESICTLLASILTGALWTGYGGGLAFGASAAAALLTLVYFRALLRKMPAVEGEKTRKHM